MSRCFDYMIIVLLCTTNMCLHGQSPIVQNVDFINTAQSEYSPIYFGDKLVYVHQSPNGRYDPKSKETFFELFFVSRSGNKKKKRFKIESNVSYHEGPVTFSRDLEQVFFTKTNTKDGVAVPSASKEAKLKIYYAFKGQYGWELGQDLPINDNERNTLHPSLSPDGNRLFFASDREADGYGGLDLYVSEWYNGKWTPPINMGPEVNTSGDECYPFIHASGQLFFSSNRSGGLGKMDLYTLDIGEREWGKVYRLPPPYNTRFDDFGFILSEDAKSGYLSSNRSGGKGEDDIYAFTAPQGIQSFIGNTSRKEMVNVYSSATSGRVPSASVLLTEIADINSGRNLKLLRNGDGSFSFATVQNASVVPDTKEFFTAADGGVELDLKEGKSYRMLVHKAGFIPHVTTFAYTPSGSSRPLEIVLQNGSCMAISGTIRSELNNDPIFGAEVVFSPVNCSGNSFVARTAANGTYHVYLPEKCDYQVTVKHQDYLEIKSSFNGASKIGSYHPLDLVLKPNQRSHSGTLGTTVNSVIVMNELQYEDDRFELKNDHITELKLLSELLLRNPNMYIRIENHTETGGPDLYHQDISEQRIESIKNYLITSGIQSTRIQAIAHGSTVPRYDSKATMNCGEAQDHQHRSNRRTEIRILSQ